VARIVYIGDEATATGFRLAGLDVRAAAPGDAAELLRQALAERPDCVLLDGRLGETVPPALLERAQNLGTTLFAIVPDVRGRGAPPDLERSVRNVLGIDA
jgi:vacuolar-type H+-ATPase subunit F/Vma7